MVKDVFVQLTAGDDGPVGLHLAIGDIEDFCEGKQYADFEVDRQLQAAVERELEVIGEALFRLRGANPDVSRDVS